MGMSPNAPTAMSTTFANNLKNGVKQVFKGTMNFPAAPKATGPAPWTHVIKLTAPGYILASTVDKSFTVDLVVTATTGYTGTHPIEAAGPDIGSRTSNPSSSSGCKFSNNKYNNSISYTTGGLTNNGGTWYVSYNSILPNAPGVMTISAFGIDNKGTWPLPIQVPMAGSGCKWNVGLELGLWIPVNANASGQARVPNLTIPPGLGGGAFYDHQLWLDSANTAGPLVVGWSSKWTIGSGKTPSGNTVYRTANTANSPTGYLRKGYVPHMRLTR
jgi:hypothetical protein